MVLTLFTSLVFLLGVVSSLSSQILREISVRGNERVSSVRVQRAAQLVEGEAYSPIKVEIAVKKLFATGLFQDIKVFGEEVDGDVKLTFEVSEAPLIHAVTIAGNNKVKDKDLASAIRIPPGSLHNPSLLQETKNQVLDVYEKKGFALARVSLEEHLDQSGDAVNLTIRIEEGKKIRVEQIDFGGNQHFSDGDLRSAFETEQDGWLPWHGTDYKAQVLDEDLGERLPALYRGRGFLDFSVEGSSVEIDEIDGKAYIAITVNEGEQYKVGNIFFSGNRVFSDEALRLNSIMSEECIFDEKRFEKSLRNLSEIYGNEGYMYASITPKITKNDAKVDIEYCIDEKMPAHVRRIAIDGNHRTREDVIRREIELIPGDLLRHASLMRSYQALMNTGYFEKVDIGQDIVQDGSGDVDLKLNVEEKRTGTASTGLGFGASGGLTGFIELSESNLFGKGQKGSARLELGTQQNNLELSFTEPYFRDTHLSLGGDLFVRDQYYSSNPYRLESVGGDIRIGVAMPGLSFARMYSTYKLERINLEPTDTTYYSADDPIYDGYPRLTSSLTFSLVRDTRDNVFHTRRGTRHSVSAEFAGGPLGGDSHFQKYRFDSSWSLPTISNFALTLRLKGGAIAGGAGDNDVPYSEKFILGGVGTGVEGLRGYSDRSVGPVVSGSVTRGNAFLLFVAQHEVKITDQVYGIMFFDAGDAWESWTLADPTSLKRALGFGIRIEIPGMGPLGIDLGYGFDRPDGPGWQTHFTFGSFFN